MQARHVARAAMSVVALAFAVPALAGDRLVHRAVDPASGAILRVYKTSSGGRIEVQATALTLKKEVAGDRIITSMRDRDDEFVVAYDARTLTVSGRAGRVSARRDDRERLERARALIAGSSTARRAAALIAQLGFGDATPVQPMLLSTRVLLLAAVGDSSGVRDLSNWARRTRLSTQVVKASFGQQKDKTPTDCWNAYVKEAIEAWTEFEDCLKQVDWYEFWGTPACTLIYEMRAYGAFSWWLSCVALA